MKATKENKYWLGKLHFEQEKASIPYEFDLGNSFTEDRYNFQIPDKQYELLQEFTFKDKLRAQIVLLAAMGVLLNKYSRLKLIRFGTSIDLQENKVKRGVVLPLELSIEPQKTFRMLLNETKTVLVESVFHQDYNFDALVQKFNNTGDYNPLYDVICSVEGVQEQVIAEKEKSNFSILFALEKESFLAKISYNKYKYSKEFIYDIGLNFSKILEIVLENIDILLEDINLLPTQDSVVQSYKKELVLNKTWIASFEERVEVEPDKVAVLNGTEQLTYKELNEASNKLAHYLDKHVSKEKSTFVALLLENSISTLVSIVGTLKAGFAFLPIDLGTPTKRIEHIIKDANPSMILVDENFIHNSIVNNIPILNVKNTSVLEGYKSSNLNKKIGLNDSAYMIYTSGTSGIPKGVIIEHYSLVNYTSWAATYYTEGLDKSANFPFFSSISFDLTITSVFVPLLISGSVIIYNTNFTEQIFDTMIKDNIVEIIKLTPSHLRLLLERIKNRQINVSDSKIHTLIVGGEAFPSELAAECTVLFPKVNIYNEYGPTEATVGCVVHKYRKNKDINYAKVPIGTPINNTIIYLLDNDGKQIPNGAIGEIYIGGKCLAQGYINNEVLTNEKFTTFPKLKGNELFYKTGDLAKRMPNGTYMYLGRKDNQIKINGYRIELEEIENYARKHPNVDEAVVIGNYLNKDTIKILLFLKETTVIETDKFMKYLSEFLPTYMLPHEIQKITNIPLTFNGKTDTSKLIALVKEKKRESELPVNEIEKKLHDIWKKHLETEVGVNDNFYTSGGDSIKSLGLMNDINKAFEIKLQIKDLYELKTIKNMARKIMTLDISTIVGINQTINKEIVKDEIDKLKNEILSQL